MCSIFGLSTKSIPVDKLKECFDRTQSRGPDMSRFEEIPCGYLGFHRLAIMGLDERGMQPFHLGQDAVVCNGELYGFRPLRERLMRKYDLKSRSDCEILLPLYHEYGVEMFKTLDAEFALILWDGQKQLKSLIKRGYRGHVENFRKYKSITSSISIQFPCTIIQLFLITSCNNNRSSQFGTLNSSSPPYARGGASN